jgi:hypothetical protein
MKAKAQEVYLHGLELEGKERVQHHEGLFVEESSR